jgi:hypothetical protein
MKAWFVAVLILPIGLLGCSDPKKTIIPSDISKWESDLKPTLDKLSPDERQTLGRYMMRAKIGEAFGGKTQLGSISIGEAIAAQKSWETELKAKVEEEKRLADELRAKRTALAQQVREMLTVVLVSKGFSKADPMNGGDFKDKVTFTLGFENKGSKDIAGFKGRLLFKDMFGDTIKALNLSHDDLVPARQKLTWDGETDFNQFMNDDVKLRDADQTKIQMEFLPDAIIFTDGSRLELPNDSTSGY